MSGRGAEASFTAGRTFSSFRRFADALKSGKLGFYGADVVSKEPIAADNPLLTAPHCILTPHIAWAPFETRVRLIDRVAENLSAFQNGNPINTVI